MRVSGSLCKVAPLALFIVGLGAVVSGCGIKLSAPPPRTNLKQVLKKVDENLPPSPPVQYVPPAQVPKFKMVESNFIQAFVKAAGINPKKLVLNKYPSEVQGVSQYLSDPNNTTMVEISWPPTGPWTDDTLWVPTDAIIQVDSQNIPASVRQLAQSMVQGTPASTLKQWRTSPVVYLDISYSKNDQNLAVVLFWQDR